MKLNVNPKELLALYNMLYERFERNEVPILLGDDTHLQVVYGRIKSYIIGTLSEKGDAQATYPKPEQCRPEQWEAFLSQEQAKIDKLNAQLSDINKDPDFFVPNPDDDMTVPDYPRRGAGHRSGRGGGRKK